MKQVKIRFIAPDGVEYAPGTKVSDEVAKAFPQFVKTVESNVIEAPVVEEPKAEVFAKAEAFATTKKATTKKAFSKKANK